MKIFKVLKYMFIFIGLSIALTPLTEFIKFPIMIICTILAVVFTRKS